MIQSKKQMASRVLALACTLALMLGAGPVLAQFPPAPQSASSERPSAPAASVSSLEGTVKTVDPAGGKVEIASGLFVGSFGRTLDVTSDTVIQVAGRQSSLSDIREGDKVRASYEVREGQSIAKSIDVRPEPRKKTAPSTAQ